MQKILKRSCTYYMSLKIYKSMKMKTDHQNPKKVHA